MSAPRGLRMTRAQAQVLVQEARAATPAECCGLLIGVAGRVRESLSLSNVAARPAVEYEAEPNELLRALLDIEAHSLELLALYHSHPAGGTLPSARDIREASYPQAAQLIIGLGNRRVEMAAWRIEAGAVTALPLLIDEIDEMDGREFGENERARPWLLAVGALITLALMMGLALTALG